MSDFEFMRSLPFGPYIPVDSPLHRLDPRARILLVLLFMIGLTAARSPFGLLLGLAAALAGWRAARVPIGPLFRGWRSALPFLLLLAVLQILFRSSEGEQVLVKLGPLPVTDGDLLAGLILVLRFSAYIAILGLAAAVMSESEVTQGLEALLRPLAALRIPVYDLVMVVQVTLRFFPLLSQTAERIAKAQASRGANWQPAGWNLIQRVRQIAPLIVPLFITSLRRAENMALAMDARGYGALPVRTSLVTLHYRRADALAVILVILIVAAMLIV